MGCTDGGDYIVADCAPSREEQEATARAARAAVMGELRDTDQAETTMGLLRRVKALHPKFYLSELQTAMFDLLQGGHAVLNDSLKISKASPPR